MNSLTLGKIVSIFTIGILIFKISFERNERMYLRVSVLCVIVEGCEAREEQLVWVIRLNRHWGDTNFEYNGEPEGHCHFGKVEGLWFQSKGFLIIFLVLNVQLNALEHIQEILMRSNEIVPRPCLQIEEL